MRIASVSACADEEQERVGGVLEPDVEEPHRHGPPTEVHPQLDRVVASLDQRLRDPESVQHLERARLYRERARLVHPVELAIDDPEPRCQTAEAGRRGVRPVGPAPTIRTSPVCRHDAVAPASVRRAEGLRTSSGIWSRAGVAAVRGPVLGEREIGEAGEREREQFGDRSSRSSPRAEPSRRVASSSASSGSSASGQRAWSSGVPIRHSRTSTRAKPSSAPAQSQKAASVTRRRSLAGACGGAEADAVARTQASSTTARNRSSFEAK